MLISDKNKFVFVAIPKTGTRTIYKILKENYKPSFTKDYYNHIPKWASKYFRFTVIRNPYARAVSLWYSLIRKPGVSNGLARAIRGMNLAEFFKFLIKNAENGGTYHPLTLNTQSLYFKSVIRFDAILRTESLEQDFLDLPFVNEDIKAKFKNKFPHLNKDVRGFNYKAYLTNEAIEAINIYYSEDFIYLRDFYTKLDPYNTY